MARSSALPVCSIDPWVSEREVPVICTPEPSDRPVAYLSSPDEVAPGAVT